MVRSKIKGAGKGTNGFWALGSEFGFRFGVLTLWIESSDVRHRPNPSLSVQVTVHPDPS